MHFFLQLIMKFSVDEQSQIIAEQLVIYFFSIDRFHEAIIKYGVDKVDIFQTNDLAERRDLGAVTNTMFALGRAVSKFRDTTYYQMLERTKIQKKIKID